MSGDFSTAGIRLQGQEGHSLTKNRITLIIFHHIFPVTAITDLHQNQCEDDSTLHHIARSWGTAPVSRGEAFPTICLGSFKTEPDDTQAKRREHPKQRAQREKTLPARKFRKKISCTTSRSTFVTCHSVAVSGQRGLHFCNLTSNFCNPP